MNETQKPFSCSVEGCEMTFTNDDHLNWHQKKHDMMLNLGLTTNKTNEVADQTPTPTRFIRNCEEVGLFQDLQNVNPFDEFFKKAVEIAKTGGSLAAPDANSEDTLHTPHILPHIEEEQKGINPTTNRLDSSQSNDFSLTNVIPITNTNNNAGSSEASPASPTIVIDKDRENQSIKNKIKEALKQKSKKENVEKIKFIKVVPFQDLTENKETLNNSKPKDEILDESRIQVREMNRAAQIRCRKRKQLRWIEMEHEIASLRHENKKLRLEIVSLRNLLKKSQKEDSDEITRLDNNKSPRRPQEEIKKINIPNSTSSNPIVIQIIPGITDLALPVVPSRQSSTKLVNKQGQNPGKHKVIFRKIVPKAVIEKC